MSDSEKKSEWFYRLNKEQKGPISEEEVSGLIKNGFLGYGTMVWKNEFPEWIKLESSDLKKYLITPPPSNTKIVDDAKSNWLLWLTAALPLLTLLIMLLSDGVLIGLAVIVGWSGIILCFIDRKNLKKTNQKAPGIIATIFYSFYLWQRNKIIFGIHVLLFIIMMVTITSVTFKSDIERSAKPVVTEIYGNVLECREVKIYKSEGDIHYATAFFDNGITREVKITNYGERIMVEILPE